MSLPAILGSAIIAFGMIPCICSITVGTDMKLQTWAVTRDSSVYVVAVYLMWIFLEDGYIDLYESSVLTAFYAVYLVIIFIPVCFCSPKGTVDYSTIEEASVEQEEEEEEEDETR
jgi:Ca2+/Na+ antiporter